MNNTGMSIQPPLPLSFPNNSPVLSLFSGAGGLDHGFKLVGFHPILAIDINPAAIDTYRANHPETRTIQADLATLDPATIIDWWEESAGGKKPIGIIGGPPCQAFSASNVHQTKDDPRRNLLDNYASILEAFATRYAIDFFVIENVPGLLRSNYRKHFEEFTGTVEQAGFKVINEILNAGTYGVPQHRKRLIAVGVNRIRHPYIKLKLREGNYEFPPSIEGAIRGLPEPAFCSRGLESENIPHHPNHVAMVPRSSRFTNGSLTAGDSKGLSFKVLSWDAPSYTVAYGHNEVHVHPDCHRRLSVYEAMLLQGFTHSYHLKGTFTEQVRLISDAVPPPFAKGIAKIIKKTFGYDCSHT